MVKKYTQKHNDAIFLLPIDNRKAPIGAFSVIVYNGIIIRMPMALGEALLVHEVQRGDSYCERLAPMLLLQDCQ